MGRKIKLTLTILTAVFLFSLTHALEILAAPPPPHVFWGEVKTNSQNVQESTLITAYVLEGLNQIICGSTQTQLLENTSVYVVNVSGDDSETPEKDGASPGDVVYFRIGPWENQEDADQNSNWQSAQATNLNLSIATTQIPTNTPTPIPNSENNLSILLKFQGINNQGEDHNIEVNFLRGGTPAYRFENLNISSDSNGVYSAIITDSIAPETYNIYVKGWAHLQKKFENITIVQGENNIDLTNQPILSGNAINPEEYTEGPNPGIINIADFSILARDYGQSGSIADFNNSGLVDIVDFSILASNYLKTGDGF